jgi:ParB family chromosome partitioning protein
MTRKVLGRGLDALLGETKPEVPPEPVLERPHDSVPEEALNRLPLDQIHPNPDQPRHQIDQSALEELAQSIRSHGLIQPLLVSLRPEGGYQIIAGERRWQAAKLADLKTVPCLLKETTPAESLTISLIENIQRQDLNPIEEALAYRRLQEESGLTQEQIASAIGRDRATVANYIRLLNLPQAVQSDLIEDRLSMGHARALLGLVESQPKLLAARAKVLHRRLTVRQTEHLVERMKKPAPPRRPTPTLTQLKAEEDQLRTRLKTKVKITRRGQKGRIIIEFFSDDELVRLLQLLSKS